MPGATKVPASSRPVQVKRWPVAVGAGFDRGDLAAR